jgi:peroxiredoxin
MSKKAILRAGDPAPWFVAECTSSPQFHFDSVAGRYVVLSFFESMTKPFRQQILQEYLSRKDLFDDEKAIFFGISVDASDKAMQRVQEMIPGYRIFWDFDQSISSRYGIEQTPDSSYHSQTVILDERLRVLRVIPFGDHPENHAREVIAKLESLPSITGASFAAPQAPVLIVPRIFEPELCQRLIRYYDERGGQESGFMREINGMTVPVLDSNFKKRRDQEIDDLELRRACMVRIHDRLAPEIQKAYQFRATRIERYIVACYEAADGGFFRAHRDNTTKATAHRRFAVSLNLNTGDFEGGCVRFPEFGPQLYVPPAGGAVVFSCSLLHEATPVTAGKRYAFLPFLYDEQAAQIRQQNASFLSKEEPNRVNSESRT